MAFQFPAAPAPNAIIVNDITGSTYQWRVDLEKWVITSKKTEVSEIIWEGDDEPNPNPGNYKLWYHTEELELYYWYEDVNGVGAWLPTSAPITMLEDLDNQVFDINILLQQVNMQTATNENEIQLVKDGLGQVDLQQACNNGYITTTPLAIETEKGVSILTEQELRITHEDNPYIRLVDQSDGDALEITLNDDHGHINMSDQNDELHFKFGNVEQITFKGDGSAEFNGKVKVTPGTEDNDAATYGQLVTVQEQIDQVVPTYERGRYNFSQEEVTSNSATRGRYNLIRKNNSSDSSADRQACEDALNTCNRIPDSDPIDCSRDYNRCLDQIPGNGTIDVYINQFADVRQIKFSQYDLDGGKHEWNDVEVGQVIDIFNDDNEDYFVGKITAIVKSTNVVTLDVDKVQAKGKATGKARIKVFTLDNEIEELANYVRKTGDTMTGTLETTSKILIRPDGKGASGANNMLVVNQEGASSGSIIRVQKDSTDLLKVEYDGSTSLMNNRLTKVATPVDDTDGVNKKYVDDNSILVGPASMRWKFDQFKTGKQLEPGEFTGEGNPKWNSGNKYYYFFHQQTNNGKSLGFYGTYHQYYKMGHLLGSFWYYDEAAKQWKCKGTFFIRDLYFGYSDSSPHLFALQTHSDFDDTEHTRWASQLSHGTYYYLKIAGVV